MRKKTVLVASALISISSLVYAESSNLSNVHEMKNLYHRFVVYPDSQNVFKVGDNNILLNDKDSDKVKSNESKSEKNNIIEAAESVIIDDKGDSKLTKQAVENVNEQSKDNKIEEDNTNKLKNIYCRVVLFPRNKAFISSEIDSTIMKYNVKTGGIFNKGDIIAQLDSRKYQHAYDLAKNTLRRSLATLKFSQDMYEINKQLRNKRALSLNELKSSEHSLRVAESDVEEAKINLKSSKDALDDCTIIAPFDGRLVTKFVHQHEFITRGTAMMELFNDTKVLAVFHLPSNKINDYRIGDKLTFQMAATGQIYKGTVFSKAGSVKPSSKTFEIKAEVDNPDRSLLAGMSAELKLL